MNLFDTSLPKNISQGLYQEKCFDVPDVFMDKVYYVLFYGVSRVLSRIKDKTKPAVFEISEISGKPIAAAICEYYEGGEGPGNWSLVWTFNKEDIPADCIKVDMQNSLVDSDFDIVAGEKFGMIFENKSCRVTLLTYIVEQLYKWLDENAKEGSSVEIDLEGVFKATVEVIDGKKVMSIEPSGEVKTLIKDDTSIEN